jgi:hypothetical protein
MKLIFCTECHDIVSLKSDWRHCDCGLSCGKYEDDGLNAVVSGPCIPLGFANQSLMWAIRKRPETGLGSRFEAFVIPKVCPTVREAK